MGIKGQKINPVGWRLGFYRKWKTLWFEDSWNYGLMLNKTLKVNELIQSFLLYKRFSALNTNTLILNEGTEKFTILVNFYNLREEESTEVKKQRKKKRGNAKFNSIRLLWQFEQKYLKGSNSITNKISMKKKYQILLRLNKKNSLYSKKHLLNRKKVFEKAKQVVSSKEIPFKTLYLNSLTQKKIESIKKYKPVNTNNNNLRHFQKNFSLNSIFFLEYLIKTKFKKKHYNTSLGLILERYVSFFLNTKPSLIISFIFILLSEKQSLSNLKYISTIDLYSKNFFLQNSFIVKSTQLETFLRNFWFVKMNKRSISFSHFQKKKAISKNKSLFLLWKLKTSMLNFNRLPIILERKKKNNVVLDFAKKKKLRKEAALDKKLLVIRQIAIQRKFKRLGLEDQASLWDLLVEPLLREFQHEKVKNLALRDFKNRVLRIFLDKMSYHIYNTLSKLSKEEVIKLIEELKKETSNKSYSILQKSDKKKDTLVKYSKWLRTKLDFINEQFYFSLNHLQKSIQFILNARVNLFFINDLSFLKFKSRLIDKKSFESTRLYGLKFLSQKLRLEKINSNRQYQKLLKEPSLIERRGKRRGPFLKDFVLLVLIALVSRNFLSLLRFIDFQMRHLAKTKRQIPFLRFLIRLISNLGGSLIKLKGLRIQFKGRFDRWNRTKSLIFTSGNIPFQRKSKDIEYSSTHGLVKKGVFGIRFWVWYGSNFHQTYYDTFTTYWYFKQ